MTDEDIDRIARRVVELLAEGEAAPPDIARRAREVAERLAAGDREGPDHDELTAFVEHMIAWARGKRRRKRLGREKGERGFLIVYANRLYKECDPPVDLRPHLRRHVSAATWRKLDDVLDNNLKQLEAPAQVAGRRLLREFIAALTPEQRRRWEKWVLALAAVAGVSIPTASSATTAKIAAGGIAVAVISITLAMMCNRGRDDRERRAPVASQETKAGSALGDSSPTSKTPIDGRHIAESVENRATTGDPGHRLIDEPYFQLRLLMQNVKFVTHPGEAPEILRQGWVDGDSLDHVPDQHREQWRKVQELDRQAAELSRAGKYDAALEVFDRLVSEVNRPDGWRELSLGPDVTTFISVALNRRLNRFPESTWNLGFDGPSVLGMTQYEFGRILEALGNDKAALAAYASAAWRRLVVPRSVRIAKARSLAASNWGHLLDLEQMYDDALYRARDLAWKLEGRSEAIVSDGMVVWHANEALVAAPLDPAIPAECDVGDPTSDRPEYHFGQPWVVDSELDGVVVESDNLAAATSSLVTRPLPKPERPRRLTLQLHRSLEGTEIPQACGDVVSTATFCFMSDGRLMQPSACP